MHFTQTVEFFQSLSIPFPYVNALTAASIECLGGILFAVGFASRLISIPLAFTMVIAYITAHSDSVKNLWENPENFTMQGPFNFLLATLIVFSFGPGVFSIDAFLKYFIVKRF